MNLFTYRETNSPNLIRRLSLMLLLALLIFGLGLMGCEGPQGPMGEQGQQGPQGPVGPAGDDGSEMYSDKGAPDENIGDIGDYYLNSNTGELYGPKDSDGWGNPAIVLMGEDGRDGADGQDGNDGSQIHSGTGAPSTDMGVIGDFYFDKNTGDFYGPKAENGWGNPTNLMGEDGHDGADGQDGEDGKDGSVIHAGNGAPSADVGATGDFYFDNTNGDFYGPKTDSGWGSPTNLMGADGQDGEDGSQIYSGSGAPSSSLGTTGDYYLDKANYELYGPKTDSGWGSPINIKGADGNANVTRYIHPEHDFSVDSDLSISMQVNNPEESAWIVYLKYVDPNDIDIYYHLPGWGYGGASQYSTFHYFSISIRIRLQSGTGEKYDNIEIVRIEANDTVNNPKQKGDNIIPEHLDISDYNEVAEYYGFNNK
ncbi:hypothetical protein LQ318_11595 [Aliifodinibius salicampi]|uniref:Collagen triple helix repeat-containing protein n=1 Tax=Fodinibius salicampi TaxID=1920655 RepID=A0ABT3Q0D1_9BACT|nr:hypothetical protein [Fodinibius salicampi]MCW9713544.1 hypothetical protein [Fodinibius salicampi]